MLMNDKNFVIDLNIRWEYSIENSRISIEILNRYSMVMLEEKTGD